MRIEFNETFNVPINRVFFYFESPKNWVKLYGLDGKVSELKDGWYSVPLHRFPFPLLAKNDAVIPNEHVHWVFKGFWKGEGDMRFIEDNGTVRIEGYEEISVRWLSVFSPILEKLFLEKHFRFIWTIGWKRLRKQENNKV